MMFVMAAEQEYGPELQRRIRPLICGVGPIEAAIATALHLHSLIEAGRSPKLVVSLGSAGSRRRATGTLWQVSSVSFRDMDASKLGFEKGVTPFAGHPARIELPTPLTGIATASLSTGGAVLKSADYGWLDTDLADMETFAVLRACQRFNIRMIGLRGVSDGDDDDPGIDGWTKRLGVLDRLLADAVEQIPAAFGRMTAEEDKNHDDEPRSYP